MKRFAATAGPIALILVTSTAWGATGDDDASIVEIEPDETAIEYLHPICGSDATMADNDELPGLDADRLPMCPALDEGAQTPDPHLLTGGYVGDFSGDGVDEAVLTLYDTTTTNPLWQYRSAVMRDLEKGWHNSDTSGSGLGLGSCQPVESPQRNWLVCSTVYVRHGLVVETWNLHFVDDGELATEDITEMVDKTGACRFDGEFIKKSEIEEIADVTGDGNVEVVFGVNTQTGRPIDGFEPDEAPVERCDRDHYHVETGRDIEVWSIGDDGLSEKTAEDITDHLQGNDWAPFVASVQLESDATSGDNDPLPEYYPADRLNEEDLEDLPLRKLSLMRNTIFARAGHEFSTEWLADYFNDQSWYEGGGLDDGEFSELDRHNVQTIRSYEDGMDERQLRVRRQRLWGIRDLPADGRWSPPGPFDRQENVIEAVLLDEALDELLDEGRAYRRPSDPGFPTGTASPGSYQVPDDLGGISLGQRLDAETSNADSDTSPTLKLLEIKASITPVVDDQNVVQRIVYQDHYNSTLIEQADAPHDRLLPMTMVATRLTEHLGPPTHIDGPRASGFSVLESMTWQGRERTIEVEKVPMYGGAHQLQLTLRTNDPQRVCGPDDGFAQWYDRFEAAFQTDDPEAVVQYFDFPFEEHIEVAGLPPDPDQWMEDKKRLNFDDRHDFVDDVPLAWVHPDPDAEPRCQPTRYAYHVPLNSGPAGALVVERLDGEWKVVEAGGTHP